MREIDKIVKDILTNYGFVFKKSSWYRVSDDFIQIIWNDNNNYLIRLEVLLYSTV